MYSIYDLPGIPCCNEEDEVFAREHALSYEQVLDTNQRLINSDKVCIVIHHQLYYHNFSS